MKITKYSIEFPLQIENYKMFKTFPGLCKVKIAKFSIQFPLKSENYENSGVFPEIPKIQMIKSYMRLAGYAE